MNNKGQSILSEHIMIFFVVVAALVAVTAFVQRGLQARIHDARNYMINAVVNSSVCDADCMAAANGVYYEYEPYYMQQIALSTHNGKETDGQINGSNAEKGGFGAIFTNNINEQTLTMASDCQLPPACANVTGQVPCYCTCPSSC